MASLPFIYCWIFIVLIKNVRQVDVRFKFGEN